MQTFLVLGVTAFLLCLGLTPLCRNLFLQAGLVDRPDSDRKFHLRAVPRMGGVPIVLSYVGALSLVVLLHPGLGQIRIQHQHLFMLLLPAAAIIFATGLLDDLVGLRPATKLLGQLAAAMLAVAMGVRVSVGASHPWLAAILSVGWLIACSNAVNLIDGMDGLATGVGLTATLTMLVEALLTGNIGLALATIPLAGALLAFLRYNFSPASVFLGDCGSLTIGFLLGCFSLVWSQHSGTRIGLLAPLMALALPLIDVGLAIGRRFLRAVPIFKGDRGHIHHMVLGLGFSTRGAAWLLYGVCGVSASLAILLSVSRKGFGWPLVLLFCGLVLFGIHKLGYSEFKSARRALSHTAVRKAVSDQIYLHELARSLLGVGSIEQWWNIARDTFLDLGFSSVELEIDGRVFQEDFSLNTRAPSCRMHLDLGDGGSMILTRMPEIETPRMMMPVLRLLQTSIEEKPPFLSFAPPSRKQSGRTISAA